MGEGQGVFLPQQGPVCFEPPPHASGQSPRAQMWGRREQTGELSPGAHEEMESDTLSVGTKVGPVPLWALRWDHELFFSGFTEFPRAC